MLLLILQLIKILLMLGLLIWSLTNLTSPFSAKCANMAITSFYNANTKPNVYLIICPYEWKFRD